MTKSKQARCTWHLVLIAVSAMLFSGGAQAGPRQEAVDWCKQYKAKHRNKRCVAVKRTRPCPSRLKKHATFGGLVKGYKACVSKRKSRSRIYADRAKKRCKALRRKDRHIRCVPTQRGLPCLMGTRAQGTFGPPGIGYKVCVGMKATHYREQAEKACVRYRKKTGGHCFVLRKAIPCKPGSSQHKVFGRGLKSFKTCVSARSASADNRKRAWEWCKKWPGRRSRLACRVQKASRPCGRGYRKARVFGSMLNGWKVCTQKPVPATKRKAERWCKQYRQKHKTFCKVRKNACLPTQSVGARFGKYVTCVSSVTEARKRRREAEKYCRMYRRTTGKRCSVVKMGLPCGPGKKVKRKFGGLTAGFKVCVKR